MRFISPQPYAEKNIFRTCNSFMKWKFYSNRALIPLMEIKWLSVFNVHLYFPVIIGTFGKHNFLQLNIILFFFSIKPRKDHYLLHRFKKARDRQACSIVFESAGWGGGRHIDKVLTAIDKKKGKSQNHKNPCPEEVDSGNLVYL